MAIEGIAWWLDREGFIWEQKSNGLISALRALSDVYESVDELVAEVGSVVRLDKDTAYALLDRMS